MMQTIEEETIDLTDSTADVYIVNDTKKYVGCFYAVHFYTNCTIEKITFPRVDGKEDLELTDFDVAAGSQILDFVVSSIQLKSGEATLYINSPELKLPSND